MINNKINRVLSLVLAFVMTVSLFSNWSMPVLAENGIKTESIDPVITTAFKDDEVKLYASVEDGALSTEVTGVAGKAIQLYNKVTDESTGKVFYQFRLAGLSTSNLGSVVDEYSFVAADEVVYQEVNSIVTETTPELEITEWTYQGSVWVTAKMPNDVTVEIEKITKPLAGTEHWLIWEKSVFFNISITDSEGNPYIPEGGIKVTFPYTTVYGELNEGDVFYPYSIYDANNAISITEGVYEDPVEVHFNAPGIVGITKRVEVEKGTADVAEVVACDDTLTFYDSMYADLVYSTVINVTDNDVLTVLGRDILRIGEKAVEVYWVDYDGENEAISYALDEFYGYVLCSDVEEYIEPAPDETEVVFEIIIESGLLSDFTVAYTAAKEKGLLENMTDEQLEEINSIKVTLEEMAANTADWSEVGVQATVESNGVKLYRNPVTRPNDYVLANKLEPMSTDLEPGIEEIEFSEANIIGKYTDKNNNTYFIVDTDNWDVFEGRVPYRYISQSDVTISSQWNSINKPGEFLKDTVKLYAGPSENYEFVEIADGLSRGELDISYEIIHTKYSGEQEKWYWVGTPNWKDANGNDVGYSRYVKAEDVYLVTAIEDASGVSVAGDIPEGAVLVVAPVSENATGIDTDKYPIGEKSLFYDISLMLGDNANTQPGEGGITVTFPAKNIPFEIGTEYYIYHVHDDVVQVEGPYVYDGGDIAAIFTNLSIIGVTSSTDVIPFEVFSPNLQYVFKNTHVRLYLSHIAGNAYKEVHVTSEDIITISGKYILEDKELMLIEGYQYTGNNQELLEAINHPDYTVPVYLLVKANDVKPYVPGYEPTDAEKLYDRLTSSYTKEEWNEIANEYTEEEFQVLLDSLTGEQLEEINECFEKLPTRFEEAYKLLLETTTSEEFREIYVSLSKDIKEQFTFAQEITLFQHRLSLLIAEFIDKPEDYEFPGTPVEAFTNAAPFVDENPMEVSSYENIQSTTFAHRATPMLLANEVMPVDNDYNPITKHSNGNLILSKTAVPNDSGGYTITLEAYAKGEVTTRQEVVPVDITFVLDVSGSMEYCIGCGKSFSNNSTHDIYSYTKYTGTDDDNTYYLASDGSYNKAYYCDGGWFNSHNAGWYTDEHDWKDHGGEKISNDNIFLRTTTKEKCSSRMNALEDAVQGFIDSTKEQNDDIEAEADKHRIAIVKFAGKSTATVGNNTYVDTYTYNYSQIVQNPTIVSAANYANMKSVVENLEPAGATQIDFGMQHAKTIVTAAKTATPNRKQVVIVFTDGTPTDQSGFKVSVANNAVNYAKQIKDTGATVYTISVANGANVNVGGNIPSFPTKNTNNNNISANYNNYFKSASVSGPNSSVTTISDDDMFGLMNRFMHLLSSNNPSAVSVYAGQERTTTTDTAKGIKYTATGQQNTTTNEWSSYYLVPTNADDLTDIFGQISNEATGESKVDMGVDTKVEDIVAPQFDLPTDASNIKVYEVPCLSYNDDNDIGTWDEVNKTELSGKYTSADGTQKDVVTVEQEGTVDVSGFDFGANFVSQDPRNPDNPNDPNPTFRGKKLQIVFDVVEDPYFLGGNDTHTNSKAFVSIEDYAFASPTVNVPVKTIKPVTQDQHIYRTNSANLKELIPKFFVEGQEQVDIKKFINGVNNAYVDLIYTIKDGNTEIGTLTIPKGKSYDEAIVELDNWDIQAGETWTPALDADKTYTIVCTVDGGTDNTSTGSATATVYVYNPVLTFKDSTDYLGDTLTYGSGVNYTDNSEVWKHGDTLSTNVKMFGTKPTVTVAYEVAYEQKPTVTENGIIVTTSDIPVQATVTIINENNYSTTGVEDTHYTVVHAKCSDSDCTYRSNAKEEFVIHVNTVSLNVSKEVTGSKNTSGEFTVTVAYASDADKQFTKELTIGGATEELNVIDGAGSIVLTLKHDDAISLTGLPVGKYTVTEDDYSTCYNTTVTGGTEITGRSAYTELTSSKVVDTIKFVNELKPGYLTIEKVIKMPAGFEASTTDEFTIVVKQGDTPVASVTLKNGETCDPIELVAGKYTVVETVRGDLYDTHDSQNQTITIEAGVTTNAMVTNPAKTGSLKVSKTIVDEAVNYDSFNDKFAVKVKVNGYTDSTLAYTIGDTPATANVDANGYVTIELSHNQSAVFKDLLANVRYEVIEVLSDDQNAVYTPTITNGASEIIAGDTQEATITNTVKTGTLIIDKNISLPQGVSVTDNETFAFTVTGPNGYKNEEVSIAKDGQTTIENLLVGEYTVVENLDTNQEKIYSTSYSTEEGKATVRDGQTAKVTVTNTVTAGKLDVTKTVVDQANNISKEKDKKFTMEITFTGDIVVNEMIGTVAGVETNVTVTKGKAKIQLAHGETAQFTNIPVGVTYKVTETDVDTNYYTVSYNNEAGTIATNTPLVTVTNTRNYGKLTITKKIQDANGNALSANEGETFVFNITKPDGENMQVVIAGTGTTTITNLPLGEYIVTEDQSWSYKYTAKSDGQNVVNVITKVTSTEDGHAVITNVPKEDKWLKADAYADNKFAPVSASNVMVK